MDFISKKYTVLMNNEPVDIWIKNDEIKKAKFMDKNIKLDLDLEAIKQIKDNPTRVVNGNNLMNNKNFTKNISQMMDSQLKLAIAKNDKKTLSRFARSDLVPENMKENFVEAINRPRGLRGMLVRAVNKTNSIFQNLAKKIDRYFDKVKDNLANQKLDPYLAEYQLKEFNKAPPLKDIDVTQAVDKKLQERAKDFVAKNKIKELGDTKTSDKMLQNEFMTEAVRAGLNPIEAKTALAAEVFKNQKAEHHLENSNKLYTQNFHLKEMQSTISALEAQLHTYQVKEAGKNETLEDFKTLSKNIPDIAAIDILVENKEYLKLDESQKLEFENKNLYNQEPLKERAQEAKEIAKELEKPAPQVETVQKREATLNFYEPNTKHEVTSKWLELQKINREEKAQNRDFMNISAVKFNGISQDSLEKWKNTAQSHGADKESTQKFVDASLRNAQELVKAGVMKEAQPGEYRFKDDFAKESLYKNLDKSVEQIAEANKGQSVQVELNPKDDLKERVQDISSDKSFEKLLGEDGQIDSQKLHAFADHLSNLATQLHKQEQANSSQVTREDIQLANKGSEQSQQNNQERERA